MTDPTDRLATIEPDRRSFVHVPDGSDFPLQNLPVGIGRRVGEEPRLLVAIGDHALDLAAIAQAGLLDDIAGIEALATADTLHPFLARDRATWRLLRARVAQLLDADDRTLRDADLVPSVLIPRDELELHVPVRPGDYVDFYSSEAHARNVGAMFRPDDEPLLPNWKHLPVGYHGRSSTIVVSGTPIVRPAGQRGPGAGDDGPTYGPSRKLDIELEVGWIAGGPGNALGRPIDIAEAGEHIYGFVLLNDWSARDIQAWEYRPLGPFLGKSFATSISPWVVSVDAFAPYRVAGPPQDPAPLPYLRTDDPWALDVDLEVAITPAEGDEHVVARTNLAGMYWTPAQQLAHLTVNGATLRPGDLHGSGTISGTEPGSYGSLLELSWNGTEPLRLGDVERTFLEDGDEVVLRGAGQRPGQPRIGFGEVRGRIVPGEA